jgi:hypothetical protein
MHTQHCVPHFVGPTFVGPTFVGRPAVGPALAGSQVTITLPDLIFSQGAVHYGVDPRREAPPARTPFEPGGGTPQTAGFPDVPGTRAVGSGYGT